MGIINRFEGTFDYSDHFTIPGWQTFSKNNDISIRTPEYYLPTEDAKRLFVGIFRLSRQDGDIMQVNLIEALHNVFPTVRVSERDHITLRDHLMSFVGAISGGLHPEVDAESAKLSAEQTILETAYALSGFNINFHAADDEAMPAYEIRRKEGGNSTNYLLFRILDNLVNRDIEMLESSNVSEFTTWYFPKFILGIGEEVGYLTTGSRQIDTILGMVRQFMTNATCEGLISVSSPEKRRSRRVNYTQGLLEKMKKIVELYNSNHERKTYLPSNIVQIIEELKIT